MHVHLLGPAMVSRTRTCASSASTRHANRGVWGPRAQSTATRETVPASVRAVEVTPGPTGRRKEIRRGSPSSGPPGDCRGRVIGPALSRSPWLEQRLRWHAPQRGQPAAMSGRVVIIPSIAPNPTISRLSRCSRSCTSGYRLRLVRKTQDVHCNCIMGVVY